MISLFDLSLTPNNIRTTFLHNYQPVEMCYNLTKFDKKLSYVQYMLTVAFQPLLTDRQTDVRIAMTKAQLFELQ